MNSTNHLAVFGHLCLKKGKYSKLVLAFFNSDPCPPQKSITDYKVLQIYFNKRC